MTTARPRSAIDEHWVFRLYVAGQTPRSLMAIENLERICAAHLADRYRIDVVDVLLAPQLASDDQILAVPTLVRKLPGPVRKLIGDLSDAEQVLQGLELPTPPKGSTP